ISEQNINSAPHGLVNDCRPLGIGHNLAFVRDFAHVSRVEYYRANRIRAPWGRLAFVTRTCLPLLPSHESLGVPSSRDFGEGNPCEERCVALSNHPCF